MLLVLPVSAFGAAWEIVPRIGTEVSYETNPDNTSRQSEEDDGYILALVGAANIRFATPRSSGTFEPLLRLRQSYGNDGNNQLDGTDFLLPLTASYSGQRSQTSMSVGYSQLPSREADYQVVDPNSPLPPGGVGCDVDIRGRCRVDETQSRWYVNPGYSYYLSPRLVASANAAYSETRYDESDITGRFNYEYVTGSASITRTLAEQHNISASVNASRYEADQDGGPLTNTTETTGVSLAYEYALAPNTSVTVAGGISVSDFTIEGRATVGGLPCLDPDLNEFVLCKTKGQDTNFVGELFLRQKLDESITTQFGVSRSVQPNSDGAETTVDLANAFIERKISPRLRASAGFSYTKQDAIGSEEIELLRQRFDRTYYRLSLKTSWNLTRHWVVGAGYEYYIDDQSLFTPLGLGDSSIDSRNQIYSLSMQYVWPAIR